MGQYSNTYHESLGSLSDETRDMHQALESLQEELKTPDWYWQRGIGNGWIPPVVNFANFSSICTKKSNMPLE
jgi:hypothetical protein